MSEHNIPTLINQYIASVGSDSDTTSLYVDELVQLIESDQLTLLQFISNLGPTLTSDLDLIRSKGIQCLNSTLSKVNRGKLSKQDINVLIEFLLNKFDDKLSLQYTLNTISILISMNNFIASVNLLKILNHLLDKYDPKKNLAKVRYESFQILNNLLSNPTFLLSRQSVCEKFTQTFIHLASGEKDPRNLLISFQLNQSINTQFQFETSNELHKQFIDDLFDVCFCYFPISFKPPPNDPYKITADDLKQGLRNTIASQSLFASESIPALIEKLSSTNNVIRCDVLTTLEAVVDSYTRETIEQYWLTLWDALKFEILHSTEISSVIKSTDSSIIPEDVEMIDDNDGNKPLILTLMVIEKIHTKVNSETMLQTIIDELKPNIMELKSKSKQSIIILSQLASLSIKNFNAVVCFLFQYEIWGKYFNVEPVHDIEEPVELDINDDIVLNIDKQCDLIDDLGYLLIGYQVLGTHENNKLVEYKDHLLIFLGQILINSTNSSLQCKSIQQLTKLIELADFLQKEEIKLVLGYFEQIFITRIEQDTDDVVLHECMNGLVTILHDDSIVRSFTIELIIIPILGYLQPETSVEKFKQVTSILEQLCISGEILEFLSIKLLNKLLVLKGQVDKVQNILDVLIKLIETIEGHSQFLTNSWYKNFLPQFTQHILPIILSNQTDYILIESMGDLIGLIIRFVDVSRHQEILNVMSVAFLTNDKNDLGIDENLLKAGCVYASVFNKILANLDKKCLFENVDFIIENIIEVVYKLENPYLRVQYLQALSLLVNKFTNDNFQELLEEKLKEFTSGNLISFEIFIWMLKGLLLKLNPVGLQFYNKLIELFIKDPKKIIAKSLQALFIDLKIYTNSTMKPISKVKNLNVKLLYKQQLFEIILPYLQNDESNEIYLYALSLIIENLSSKILLGHLDSILPLTITSLKLSKPSPIILKSSLSTLNIILNSNKTLVESNVPELIPILVNLSQSNTEDVRILALKNLISIFTQIDDSVKFKSKVISELSPCLDDKKRQVRKLAIDLRQILYELK
ncbi:uncharacterized protein J8A68_004911 [[Candida] subhashii]|uniref:MMS19 nucleotide excision repair protein n=1 Tax=[Candida] subhashii TaxID=561895 RepID=A0A8J5QE88_9ASCO|nr:uncharacterized protein J8A68_004911 [[Candida] subhashii]KAG7661542.1 hypothetical protein J8A68_004911 [[Candida] subhashii]